jgi:hypothetical protein
VQHDRVRELFLCGQSYYHRSVLGSVNHKVSYER